MQAILTIYLALITALGPWLCCCAGDMLAQKPVLSANSKDPAPNALPSCCRQKQKKPVPVGDQPSTPPKCSCQQHRPDALLTSSDDLQAVSFVRTLALPPELSPGVLTIAITASRELPAPPDRSPGDILRALHILRC